MRRLLIALMFCAFGIGVRAQGPATVTVTDTLVTPSGLLASGTITVSNAVAMTSLDGFVIPQGQKITVKITNGVFAVPLVPNIGASPSGSVYFADYSTPSARYREHVGCATELLKRESCRSARSLAGRSERHDSRGAIRSAARLRAAASSSLDAHGLDLRAG
jgi:hypothetical protein